MDTLNEILSNRKLSASAKLILICLLQGPHTREFLAEKMDITDRYLRKLIIELKNNGFEIGCGTLAEQMDRNKWTGKLL